MYLANLNAENNAFRIDLLKSLLIFVNYYSILLILQKYQSILSFRSSRKQAILSFYTRFSNAILAEFRQTSSLGVFCYELLLLICNKRRKAWPSFIMFSPLTFTLSWCLLIRLFRTLPVSLVAHLVIICRNASQKNVWWISAKMGGLWRSRKFFFVVSFSALPG